MPASLTLTKSTTLNTGNTRQVYGLVLNVVNAVDIPAEIFVFQRNTPAAGDRVDTFIGVADPVALEEFPPNSPSLLDNMPYYRLSTLTLWLRTATLMDETYEMIKEDVQGLVDSLNVGPLENSTTTELFT